MYACVTSRQMALVGFLIGMLATATPAAAQHEGHVMPQRDPQIPDTREGSGTSWLPDESPMYAIHVQAKGWMVMGHGNVFLQYLDDSGDRGRDQFGSINWMMGMAHRPLGKGRLSLRGMVSLEPFTIGGCGYPDLLASGESCDGAAIHDRQHPHDLFMEIAAEYDRPIGKTIHLQLYGGPVGEPALGPVAFMHRVSGMPNPLAPIGHHWFDATHISYGVMTAGVYAKRWKVEGSLFNGREPDEHRTDFDLAALDSWSGRAWFLPSSRWSLQVSAGHLNDAETGHDAGEPTDIDRVTASVTYHRTTCDNVLWASTVGWGRNVPSLDAATNALLAETSVNVRERHVWYGRFEWVQKSGHDLDVPADSVFDVAKAQAGYTRYMNPWKMLTAGIGATVTTGIVPASLEPVYGGRFNPGFGVYLTVRPASHTP